MHDVVGLASPDDVRSCLQLAAACGGVDSCVSPGPVCSIRRVSGGLVAWVDRLGAVASNCQRERPVMMCCEVLASSARLVLVLATSRDGSVALSFVPFCRRPVGCAANPRAVVVFHLGLASGPGRGGP